MQNPESGKTIYQKKILLAEDCPVSQMIVTDFIGKAGFGFAVVGTGLEAVHSALSGSYDLVLMDVQMPLMDGVEATRQIRKAEAAGGGRRVPIVAMTAYVLQEDQNQCFDAGMDDYLQKPIDADRLCEVLEKWLEGSSGG